MKDQESSYQVRQILGTFWHLIAPILVLNGIKGFWVAWNAKKITFVWIWDELESKNSFQRQ